jgi:hypothetical protein
MWQGGPTEIAQLLWNEYLFDAGFTGILVSGSPVLTGKYTASATVITILELAGAPVLTGKYTASSSVVTIVEVAGAPVYGGYTSGTGSVRQIVEVAEAAVFGGYTAASTVITLVELNGAATFAGYLASGTVEVIAGTQITVSGAPVFGGYLADGDLETVSPPGIGSGGRIPRARQLFEWLAQERERKARARRRQKGLPEPPRLTPEPEVARLLAVSIVGAGVYGGWIARGAVEVEYETPDQEEELLWLALDLLEETG